LLPLAACALADDSAMSWSGAPKMMHGNTTVRMVSEKVIVKTPIDSDFQSSFDCNFVFHNDGPATDIRIGFPDRANGAYTEDYFNTGSSDKPTFYELKNFKSWVDGKLVKTTLLVDKNSPDANYAGSWHTKTVHFPANTTVNVRDTFTQRQSGGIGTTNNYISMVRYVMSTGASWKGNIGSAEVDVIIPGMKSAKPFPGKPDTATAYTHWTDQPKGTIFYTGFAAPTQDGNTLIFKRNDFKPTLDSDIYVVWQAVEHTGGG
jgi:hypothetical protein